MKEECLWCLPYDTDSVFKPFLKIPFSVYLNNLISNEHFPAYQASAAIQLKNKALWNEKCWRLLQYFQFLNDCFDIGVWDNHINFIEDNHLRNIMGFFRLWIDTERMYLLNFLKLDSNEFQDDRIFMTLFRTILFFHNLFKEYLYNDFDTTFLNQFISSSLKQLRALSEVCTNQTSDVIEAIVSLLTNLSKKKDILIEHNTLQTLLKSATIKVSREGEMIREVESRLQNSAIFKRKIDEETRLKKISKIQLIQDLAAPIRKLYDPIYKIEKEYDIQFYGPSQDKEKRKEEGLQKEIATYKAEVKGLNIPIEQNVYQTIERTGNNPYSVQNYQIYGQVVKIDMDLRNRYEKQKVVEVASVDENDRSKMFYEPDFINKMENAHGGLGRVTEADVSSHRSAKKLDFKEQDENTRVFNLKWHHDPLSSRRALPSEDTTSKDYDNNLLFKSPFQQQLLENKKNNLDQLKDLYEVNSYTVALLEQAGEEIFPEKVNSSQGVNPFIKKEPQVLDVPHFKLLNQNKFDFMRKVIGYMAAQKKIQKVIMQKPVPQLYPRHYCDVRQRAFDSRLQEDKMKLAMGTSDRRPLVYL